MIENIQTLPLDAATLPIWRQAYAQLTDRCIYAAPEYIAFLQGQHGDPAELLLYREGERFVYFPYFKRTLAGVVAAGELADRMRGRYDAYSSWYYGGPYVGGTDGQPGLAERFRQALDAHAAASGCVCMFVRFDPNAGNVGLLEDEETVLERPTVFVDLRHGWEAVWAGFHESNRRAVRRASALGLAARLHLPSEDSVWEAFAQSYMAEMLRKNAPRHLRFDHRYFDELRQSLPDHVVLIAAWQGRTFAGGFVVAFDDRSAFHFLSASDPAYWQSRVNNLLFTEAIRWAHDNGKDVFDFMGGRPGVFRFKSNFSQTRGQFYVRRKIYDQESYDALSIGAGKGNSGDDFFPAYRAP